MPCFFPIACAPRVSIPLIKFLEDDFFHLRNSGWEQYKLMPTTQGFPLDYHYHKIHPALRSFFSKQTGVKPSQDLSFIHTCKKCVNKCWKLFFTKLTHNCMSNLKIFKYLDHFSTLLKNHFHIFPGVSKSSFL